MDQQQLSSDGRAAFEAFNRLSIEEKGNFVALASTVLAGAISRKGSTATPEVLAEASSAITDGLQAARAHGFKQVIAPDGTAAIEVKITRANGEEITCLLSEGARDKWYRELADYGKNELQGVTLLSRADFEAVVESLYNAIRGQTVIEDWPHLLLQTEDAALKQAVAIVTEGVRKSKGALWAIFYSDDRGAVVGWRVDGVDGIFGGYSFWKVCGLFGASSAESKK